MEHFWCIDESRTNTDSQNSPQPKFEGNHHLPPYNILCDWSWGLHPNVIFIRIPKLGVPKLEHPPFWRPIISYANLQLKQSLKQHCNPCRNISNAMWHATWTHIIQNDSWLLMVENQINTSTLGLFFGHNLCCKYSNGSCKPILDIYILRTLQWYKKNLQFNEFWPSNRSLWELESIKTPTPKMGVHLGMCGFIPSHSLALLRMWMWFPGYIFSSHFSMPLPWSRAQG